MRRWALVMFAVVGLGVVHAAIRPWETPIDYHKREYLVACKRLTGTSRIDRLQRVLAEVIKGSGRTEVERREDARELRAAMTRHRAALVNLGYLVERRIGVSNRAAIAGLIAGFEFGDGPAYAPCFERFDWVAFEGDTIVVTAVPTIAPIWEQIIRKEDVPPWKDCGTCRGLIK